jgi:hypothetical protein
MTFPRFKAGPVEYWLGGAITEFINGFIAGLGGGSVVGAGMGATTAGTSLGEGLSALNQVGLALASAALAAAGNGMKRVIVWHNSNPFPNPWLKPTATPADKLPSL